MKIACYYAVATVDNLLVYVEKTYLYILKEALKAPRNLIDYIKD